jgi:hypothetical protein
MVAMSRTTTERYPCDCCGHLTLDAPGDRSDQLCPVCFWEHTDPNHDHWNGSNAVTLSEAQRNFVAFGAAEEEHVDVVRPPRLAEPRDPDFLPWEQAKQRSRRRLFSLFQAAFADVHIDGGTTLFDAEMNDDYGLDSPRNDPIRDLPYTTWEALPRPLLDGFRPLSFFDAKAVRFHLPAYMMRAIEDGDDNVVFWLTPSAGELADWWVGKFSLVNSEQASAIVEFLKFIRRYDNPIFAADTLPALSYWEQRCRG